MDHSLVKAAIEAQFLMGHRVPNMSVDAGGKHVTDWHWDVDLVRQQLYVPLNNLWDARILELERQGLTSFAYYTAPKDEAWDAAFENEPRENLGSVDIYARGVLKLADLYGRPYVRYGESPALFAHWELVQTEMIARLKAPMDEEKFAREYPERARHFRTWLQEDEDGLEERDDDV